MARIIALHAHRGGTGRSTVAANLARLAAADGRRVALVDTALQAPAAHVLLGTAPFAPERTLAGYLTGRCEIEETAVPLAVGHGDGGLFLVPARAETAGIHEIIAQGYDVGLLREGFDRLADLLRLDALLLDTHAGTSNETAVAVASADTLLTVTRPCPFDLSGVGEAVGFALRPNCPERVLVVNMVPPGVEPGTARRRAEAAYGMPASTVLPYVPELACTAGDRLFADVHPGHPLTARLAALVPSLLGTRPRGGAAYAHGTGAIRHGDEP
ncbi:MinD/ParA family protein [Streptomyces luteireticuli]|uniref:MinD/ParA family ATP-binding protein n=1 Tax=Streptomyces luteireticuli TaxID=173858 RepID=UPI00355685A3